jgi:hypothetical protein
MDQSTDVQRQQLVQRIEIGKANLFSGSSSIWDAGEMGHSHNIPSSSTSSDTPRAAAIVTKLSVKQETKPMPATVEKDFFGRPIVRKTVMGADGVAEPESKPLARSSGANTSVGVYFKFQEGFTNAVRRKVYTKDLL